MTESSDYNKMKFIRINARIIRAQIRISGMIAENEQRKISGLSLAYVEEDFLKVIDEEDISENSIIAETRELY